MKLAFDFIKLIGFVIACGLVTNYMRYYVIISHFSLYSVITSVIFQILVIYTLYKRFIE